MITMEISLRHYWNTNAKLEKILLHLRANAPSKTIQEPYICIVNSTSGYDYNANYKWEIVESEQGSNYNYYLDLYFGNYSYGFISIDKIYGLDNAAYINLIDGVKMLYVNEIPETASNFWNMYEVVDSNNFNTLVEPTLIKNSGSTGTIADKLSILYTEYAKINNDWKKSRSYIRSSNGLIYRCTSISNGAFTYGYTDSTRFDFVNITLYSNSAFHYKNINGTMTFNNDSLIEDGLSYSLYA